MEQEENKTQLALEPVTMKSLLEAGVHFGHQTRRWHPKMKRYIFAQRNGIHIVDLQKTLDLMNQACAFVASVVASGSNILMVGTKKQAQDAIQLEAQRCGAFYINQRWLGGTLTNFTTIQSRIDYMVRLEEQKEKGELDKLPKKEALGLTNKLAKLEKYLGGIKEMTKLPGAIFVIDIGQESIAVAEAKRVGVPVVALVDTDCNPSQIDYPIPGNDDAIRSVRLLCNQIANSVANGLAQREVPSEEELEEDSEGTDELAVPASIEGA